MQVLAYLALGSNLGDRARYLRRTVVALKEIDETEIDQVSSVYESEPWGYTDQDAFLNQVVALKTRLTPWQLLQACRDIEDRFGRERILQWGPRTIDIDLLLFGDRKVSDFDLQVPHPRISERRFVLAPLAELAPDLHIPGLEMDVRGLLDQCPDHGKAVLYREEIAADRRASL